MSRARPLSIGAALATTLPRSSLPDPGAGSARPSRVPRPRRALFANLQSTPLRVRASTRPSCWPRQHHRRRHRRRIVSPQNLAIPRYTPSFGGARTRRSSREGRSVLDWPALGAARLVMRRFPGVVPTCRTNSRSHCVRWDPGGRASAGSHLLHFCAPYNASTRRCLNDADVPASVRPLQSKIPSTFTDHSPSSRGSHRPLRLNILSASDPTSLEFHHRPTGITVRSAPIPSTCACPPWVRPGEHVAVAQLPRGTRAALTTTSG